MKWTKEWYNISIGNHKKFYNVLSIEFGSDEMNLFRSMTFPIHITKIEPVSGDPVEFITADGRRYASGTLKNYHRQYFVKTKAPHPNRLNPKPEEQSEPVEELSLEELVDMFAGSEHISISLGGYQVKSAKDMQKNLSGIRKKRMANMDKDIADKSKALDILKAKRLKLG